jgi:hypothetical protein
MSKDTHIEEALDYLGQDARALVMDSIAVTLHNTWATLEANRPEEDAEWLARNLYDRLRRSGVHVHWDNLLPVERESWLDSARAVIELLPLFCGRIANRYDAARQAMEQIAKIERQAMRKLRDEQP